MSLRWVSMLAVQEVVWEKFEMKVRKMWKIHEDKKIWKIHEDKKCERFIPTIIHKSMEVGWYCERETDCGQFVGQSIEYNYKFPE